MGIIYKMKTPKGIYYGKLAGTTPLVSHLERLWKKFESTLASSSKDTSASKTLFDEDLAAIGQLEQEWLAHVQKNGFNPENKFIEEVGYINQTALHSWAYSSTFMLGETRKKLGSYLQFAWGRDELSYIEAMVIMSAAWHNINIHNTQIDFLGRKNSGLNRADINTMISENAFTNSLKKNNSAIEEAIAYYNVKVNNNAPKSKSIDELTSKVLQNAKVIRSIDKSLTDWIVFTRSVRNTKNKDTEEYKRKVDIKNQVLDAVTKKKSIQVNEWANLAKSLSEATKTWLTRHKPPEIPSDTARQYDSYKKNITNKIAKLFQSYCESTFDPSNYNSFSKTLKKGPFQNWPYIQRNWWQFYAEQMSIYYGRLFGPLVKISDTPNEWGEYEFGRSRLKRGKHIRRLFTALESDIEDNVHQPVFMKTY